jgi:drug/metabolite transporter (DMT)-like permease
VPLVIGLAIIAAICVGTGDFLAGVVGRRDPTNSALTVAYLVVMIVGAAIATLADGWPTASGLGWGTAMGVFWAIAIFAIARGMAYGRVVVVIPTAGVLSAAIPVAVDLVTGGRPGPVVGIGVVVGLVAVALIGLGSSGDQGRSVAWSAAQGAIGGVATGISLVLMDQAADGGLWPLAAAGLVAAASMTIVAAAQRHPLLPSRPAIAPAALMGLLVAGAFAALMIAFPRGSLTVIAVIVSQYPAVTIVLAALVWRQRPRGVQYLGVALTLVAVALIALG